MYPIIIWPFCDWIPPDFLLSLWCSKYLRSRCSLSFSLRPLVGLLRACKHRELCRSPDLWWADLISSEVGWKKGWKSWKHGVNVAASRQLELCFSFQLPASKSHSWLVLLLLLSLLLFYVYLTPGWWHMDSEDVPVFLIDLKTQTWVNCPFLTQTNGVITKTITRKPVFV